MISVVIPAYNIEKYIEKCVKSILNQTYTDIEVLIVNDGSTDNTPQICDMLATFDKRVRVFHKENGGVSSARNLALENANGEWISMIDGDDWIEPTLFEDAISELNNNDAQVFMFEYFIDKDSESIVHKVNDSCYGVLDTEATLKNTISSNNRFLWSKIFSAKLLMNTKFDTDIILGEDTLFICEIITRATKCVYSDKPYYHYAIRENSACTSKFNIRKMSGVVAYSKIADMCNECGFHSIAKLARGATIDLGLFLCRLAAGGDDKKTMYRTTKKQIHKNLFSILFSGQISCITKIKALVGSVSIGLAVWICNLFVKN